MRLINIITVSPTLNCIVKNIWVPCMESTIQQTVSIGNIKSSGSSNVSRTNTSSTNSISLTVGVEKARCIVLSDTEPY